MNTAHHSAATATDLRAKRDRLRAEIGDAEAKLTRLRAALDTRRRNLSRLDAQLALAGEEARGSTRHV